MNQQTISEGKTMAVISYITVFGLLIAFLVNSSKNNEFTKYHIGQSVRLVLLGIANYILSAFIPDTLGMITMIVGLGILVLMVLGIINAANGKAVPLPLIGTIG